MVILRSPLCWEAHKNAVDYLCSYIEEHIILHLKVERMTMLRERYLLYLLENHPDYCNENYKREKLKEKLRKHFGNRVQFWKPSSRGGELVYSEEIATGQAVEVAFELAVPDERRIEEAAMIIRRNIIECKVTRTMCHFLLHHGCCQKKDNLRICCEISFHM